MTYNVFGGTLNLTQSIFVTVTGPGDNTDSQLLSL